MTIYGFEAKRKTAPKDGKEEKSTKKIKQRVNPFTGDYISILSFLREHYTHLRLIFLLDSQRCHDSHRFLQ
jgi:hypothetical protein